MAKATGNRTSYILSLPGGIKLMSSQQLGKVAERIVDTIQVNNGLTRLYVRNNWSNEVIELRVMGTSEVQMRRTEGWVEGWPNTLLKELKARGIMPTEPRGEAH